jgi:hypothetical protein
MKNTNKINVLQEMTDFFVISEVAKLKKYSKMNLGIADCLNYQLIALIDLPQILDNKHYSTT